MKESTPVNNPIRLLEAHLSAACKHVRGFRMPAETVEDRVSLLVCEQCNCIE